MSSAIRLLEAGFDVEIIAKEFSPNTTSDTAAAIWYPYRCYPEDKALKWGEQTLNKFVELYKQPECGVFPVQFTEYLPDKSPDPWWKSAVRNFKRVHTKQLPAYYKDGYIFEVPFMDTSIYMPWLMNRFEELGGSFKKKNLSTIYKANLDSSLIINCSGVGAKSFVEDREVYPVQGQVIKVKGENDGGYYLDQHGELSLCYVLPRKNDIVLGGTAVEHEGDRNPDDNVTEQILQKAKKLDPSLRIHDIVKVEVGLRPARSEIRLSTEKFDQHTIIHNYGHGGAGFTLSWGCADEVCEQVKIHAYRQ